jgi:hypothetical protein
LIITAALCCYLITPTQAQANEELEGLSTAELTKLQAQIQIGVEQTEADLESAKAKLETVNNILASRSSEVSSDERDYTTVNGFQVPTTLRGPPINSLLMSSYEVDSVIIRHKSNLDKCHEDSGSRFVSVTFELDDEGRVISFELDDRANIAFEDYLEHYYNPRGPLSVGDLSDNPLEQCLFEVFQEMVFTVPYRPPHIKNVVRNYPFILNWN